MVLLGAGQVEGHHAAPLPVHRQLGQFQGALGFDGTDARDDDAGLDTAFRGRPLESGLHRSDDLVVGQALPDVHQRAEADLQVPDAFGGEVDGQFVGHALQILGGLQHGRGVVEVPQKLVGAALAITREVALPDRGLVGRNIHAGGQAQLAEGRHAQGTVQVAVQVGLGQRSQQVIGNVRPAQDVAASVFTLGQAIASIIRHPRRGHACRGGAAVSVPGGPAGPPGRRADSRSRYPE